MQRNQREMFALFDQAESILNSPRELRRRDRWIFEHVCPGKSEEEINAILFAFMRDASTCPVAAIMFCENLIAEHTALARAA